MRIHYIAGRLAISLYVSVTFVLAQTNSPALVPINPLANTSQPVAFEVASVKLNPVPVGQVIIPKYQNVPTPRAVGNRFSAPHATVQDLVLQAYGMYDYEVSGLPDWAKAPAGEHYDIEAKTGGQGSPQTYELQQMIQGLLANRFQLKLHRDRKVLSMYRLRVDISGARFRQLGESEAVPTYARRPPEMPSMKGTFSAFLQLIRAYADRPIIDETGLSGKYEYENLGLGHFAQEQRADPLAAQGALATALKEKLGLVLESTKRMTEVLVIDHVERPSQN